MWKEFNNNPRGQRVGDCAIRAVAAALNLSWERAYYLVTIKGYDMADMPSSNAVWGAVLKDHGFTRKVVPDTCPECYTAEDFCNDHPKGIYVLGFGEHTATAINGCIYDSWDSSQEVPQYYWYRKDR